MKIKHLQRSELCTTLAPRITVVFVVFPSLNKILYDGPCPTSLLFDILLPFGAHGIAVAADIEKAYLQISVTESERDHLRFLWFDNIYIENLDIVKYQF